MPGVSISLQEGGTAAAVSMLTLSDGRVIVAVTFDGCIVSMPGYGTVAADYARDLGLKLIEAAARMPVKTPEEVVA